jgi:hypothetical protein
VVQQVGGTGVANYANTTPGSAVGVVADSADVGEPGLGVGGAGVVVRYSTTPYTFSYLLLEAGAGYLLLESGGKIILGASP